MVHLGRRRSNSLTGENQVATNGTIEDEIDDEVSSNEEVQTLEKKKNILTKVSSTRKLQSHRPLFSRRLSKNRIVSDPMAAYVSPHSDSAINDNNNHQIRLKRMGKLALLVRRNAPSSPSHGRRSTVNYPAPNRVHRVRSCDAMSSGNECNHGMSVDPEYFPPNPLIGFESIKNINGGHGSNAESGSRVRYGDFVRFWAYSHYVQQGGFIGSLRRTMRGRNAVGKGELFVIPPVTLTPQLVFHEACFKIVDPFTEKEEGEELLYGEEISLVDDRGMVWNNKDGRLHGRLGPSLFGNGGHMHLTLHKQVPKVISMPEAVDEGSPTRKVENSPDKVAVLGDAKGKILQNSMSAKEAVRYGDSFEMVATKVRPKREEYAHSSVTHYRRKNERDVGGFLRSDGKGISVTFQIQHAPPRIMTVMIYSSLADGSIANTHTHHKVAWNQEILFQFDPDAATPRKSMFNIGILSNINRSQVENMPNTSLKLDDSVASAVTAASDKDSNVNAMELLGCGEGIIRILLSNGGEIVLKHADIISCKKKPTWFNVQETKIPTCLLAKVRVLRGPENGTSDTSNMDKKKAVRVICIMCALAVLKISLIEMAQVTLRALSNCWLYSKLMRIFLEASLLWLVILTISKYPSIAKMLTQIRRSCAYGATTILGESQATPHAIKLMKCENGFAKDQPPIEVEDSGPEVEVPETFLLAERGNADRALVRYLDTLKWRKEIKADECLKTPHPKFLICKKYYPSCLHGRDKQGGIVYYELLGGVKVDSLKEKGIDSTQLLWHYMFQMENLWTNVAPGNDDRSTTVLDMQGVALKDVGGEVLAFVKASIGMLAAHYPARASCIFILNVPSWFSYVFRMIRPLLNEETRSKIRPCDSSQCKQALLDWIDTDQLPSKYGGTSKYELFEHPFEKELESKVRHVLSRAGMEMEAA